MKKSKHQNTYPCSDGTRVTKSFIDRMVTKAKADKLEEQRDEHGYNFCSDCAQFGIPEKANEMELRILDCSHNISVDRCQKHGMSELAWDKTNITIRCRVHHRIIDKTN